MRPAFRRLSMDAMPTVTTQNTTGTTIISTSPMNQSFNGLKAAPNFGATRPTAMPSTPPMSTWNHSSRISRPNRDRRGRAPAAGAGTGADMGRAPLRIAQVGSAYRGVLSARGSVKRAQHLVERALGLEPDSRDLGQPHPRVRDDGVVGETTGGLEFAGVGLVATELEGGGDVQRELMAAMRNASPRRPAVLMQHLLDPQIFGEAVAQCRVDLDVVTVGAHPAVADQVPRVLYGEQVLPCRDGSGVLLGQHRVQPVVQWVPDLLVPEQPVRLDGAT